MPKKAKKSGTKKRKEAPPSDAAPVYWMPEALRFDLKAGIRQLQDAKSKVSAKEIRTCVADINYKLKLPAIAAIMCHGCCICNTMLLTICAFVYRVVAPSFFKKDIADFKKDCKGVTEYIALKTGEIRVLDLIWARKNIKELDERSADKIRARLKNTEPVPDRQRGSQSDDEEMEEREQDADARDLLEKNCTQHALGGILKDVGGVYNTKKTVNKAEVIDAVVEKIREEVSGLQAVWKSNSTRCCTPGRVCST